ncbi:hypothetical protein ACN079_22135 [Pseudomonas sp. ABY48]|uniref:hypothetical protein n=1 Tax=Pseudomonas sp. ABY48 TaxID=3402865 RepID=UPI003B43ADAD
MYPFFEILMVGLGLSIEVGRAGINVEAMVRSEQNIVNSAIGILFDNRPKN